MAVIVILVLCILWAVVLIPPILRSKADSGNRQVSGGMGQVLSIFSSAAARVRGHDRDGAGVDALVGPTGPTNGMGYGAPARTGGGMSTAQRRRRDILIGLLCAVGITLIMAAFSNGSVVFFGLNIVCDVALGAYIYLLLQMKSRQQSRRTTVPSYELAGARRLRAVPPLAETSSGAEPMLALRRTASY
ncbi:MAG TPA: hypothetical protein VI462_12550 [Acidimicrobiia bacterium]